MDPFTFTYTFGDLVYAFFSGCTIAGFVASLIALEARMTQRENAREAARRHEGTRSAPELPAYLQDTLARIASEDHDDSTDAPEAHDR